MTDEEAIAMAMLLGCEFWSYDYGRWTGTIWHVHNDCDHLHPLEIERHRRSGYAGYKSKNQLARAYIKWFQKENGA